MIFAVAFPDLVSLTWRKYLCDLIRGQARSWAKGERLGGRGRDFFAHHQRKRVSGSTKELPALNKRSLVLQLHVTGRDQLISLSLKQPTWPVPVPALKNLVVHFLPPGAAAFSRERENSSQHSTNLLTGPIKQRGQQQALAAASSPLQEYRTWTFSP